MEDKLIQHCISVRYEATGKTVVLATDDLSIKRDDLVVCEAEFGGNFARAVSDVSTYDGDKELMPIIRKASPFDIENYNRNKIDAKEALAFCQKEADMLGLEMRLAMAEYTLDRSKLTFIYTADERVDFRELLKILASNFHCRIELRQVGARDKAKLIKGVGPCGRELCCGRFMSDFDMVSINMAKNQLLALNIQKLSGHCGKLMCCLKFEDEAYKELRQGLPKLNAQVEYEGENFRLTSMNVIARTCKLENKENAIFISLDDLLAKGQIKKPQSKRPDKDETTEELSE